jgi:hypothetical protein
MTTKWADYGISKASYNAPRTHITKVMVHEDKGKTIGPGQEWTRSQVVSAIERGKSFVTILRTNNKWKKGQDVHIITVNNVKYIRTDQNRIASDNLENLPEF